jgi:hypothetical protein
MEKISMSSDKIFELIKNPFANAKQDRVSLKKLLKYPWIINTSENPFSEEALKIDKKTFKKYGVEVPTWAYKDSENLSIF